MKKFLLKLLAACMLLIAPVAMSPTSVYASMPKKAGHFKSSHFGKADHMKFKKVKRKKPEFTKSKTHPDAKLHRFDKKRMHSGEARSYIFGIPIKQKGY
jgi:hypothetical protein